MKLFEDTSQHGYLLGLLKVVTLNFVQRISCLKHICKYFLYLWQQNPISLESCNRLSINLL